MRQQPGGRWVADAERFPRIRVSGSTREQCLAGLRRAIERAGDGGAGGKLTLVVEVLPQLAGVAEAAQVMGWDKRRVVTYIDRGRFPEPVQALASGRVWIRSEVEKFAKDWRAARAARARKR